MVREQRESPRFETNMVVSRRAHSTVFETHGNVGIGGFCFECEQVLAQGEELDILIDLTDTGHWVAVCGQVLGCVPTKNRQGVRGRFTRIDFEDKRMLARWLDRRVENV